MAIPDGLGVFVHAGDGYKPLHDYDKWRVAVLNYAPTYDPQAIADVSRHMETDEIFVLVRGSCRLLLAGDKAEPGELRGVWLEEGTIYNVEKGIWHNHILTPGTSVLIVENSDTSPANTETKSITARPTF